MERKRQIRPVEQIPPSDDGAQAIVRAAKSSDLLAIAQLDERITSVSKPAYWQEMMRRYGGEAAEHYFLVAEDNDGVLLGFVIGEIRAWEFGSPPAGWIFAINVDPDTRLGGIGTRLFDEVCARFKVAGVRSVRTMVDRRDHLILSFFRSQGMMAGPSLQLEMEIRS
jgi:ribosomal protein S18 acetylase RimI-like enzyme